MTKTLEKGRWVLTHERYINDFGIETDSFDLFDKEQNLHIPFLAPIKVSEKGNDFPINRIPHEYTEQDYEDMLNEIIAQCPTK